MGNDFAGLFQTDSAWTTRTIVPHVEISTQITETATVGFYGCGNAGYSNFYNFKNNAAYFDPMRASVYHYVIAGHQQRKADCSLSVSSGISEILGNDYIVTLGSGFTGTNGSTLEQRGTYVHELGHNLSLVHNGNGDNGGANSCVHTSVMNYRYQLGGWGDGTTPTLRKQAYSRGSCDAVGKSCGNTCTAACVPKTENSPKSACIVTNNGSCDCDKPEWTAVNLNFPRLNDDLTAYHPCSNPSNQCGGAEGFSAYFLGNAHGLQPKHRRFGERKRRMLLDRGLVEGTDFQTEPTTGKVFSVE
ncbi:MAG: hypothetical protein ABI488_23745 [Polyangiaceae bacterium]